MADTPTESCFFDYVGIKVCEGDPVPSSGLYINSLPGISLEAMDKISTTDQITFRGMYADAQREAWTLFRINFIAEVNKCFELTKRCDYTALLCANKETLVYAWRYCLGATIMQYRIFSNRLNRYTTLDRDQAKETLAMYQNEYGVALAQTVKLINYDTCRCMDSNNNPQYVIYLP